MAKAARRTNSRPSAANSSTSSRQNGVSTKRSATPSTISHEWKSPAQAWHCAFVTLPGSSVKAASSRASRMPLAQRSRARAWSRFILRASCLSVVLPTPSAVAVSMPKRAMPARFSSLASARKRAMASPAVQSGEGVVTEDYFSSRASSEEVSQRLPPMR